ncbi:MAG: DUF5996 family protein [Vicinamibacterales bacterium]
MVPKGAAEVEWPEIPLADWRDTYRTLHMWTQVVGKVRLALVRHVNHYWNVTLYLTSRGLTRLAMPYRDGTVGMTFDFIDHHLRIETSDGQRREIALAPRSVEIENPIRFDRDHQNQSYDRTFAERWWRATLLEFAQSTYEAAATLGGWDRTALEA